MRDQEKTESVELDDAFAKRRRALLKNSGKLAVAAPTVTLLMSSGSGSKYALAWTPDPTEPP